MENLILAAPCQKIQKCGEIFCVGIYTNNKALSQAKKCRRSYRSCQSSWLGYR